MNYLIFRHFVLMLILLNLFHSSQAQNKSDSTLLLGSWILEKQVFVEVNEDSLDIKKNSSGHIVKFETGNRFITQKRVGESFKIIGTGSYQVDFERKILYQNDLECEIIKLTANWLILKVDDIGIELHFKKM